jgi:hypothetical protein
MSEDEFNQEIAGGILKMAIQAAHVALEGAFGGNWDIIIVAGNGDDGIVRAGGHGIDDERVALMLIEAAKMLASRGFDQGKDRLQS